MNSKALKVCACEMCAKQVGIIGFTIEGCTDNHRLGRPTVPNTNPSRVELLDSSNTEYHDEDEDLEDIDGEDGEASRP